MNAAFAPLTFSWRGSHSGGWTTGMVLATPRGGSEVVWRIPERVRVAAQGGFDLGGTLDAFEERLLEDMPVNGNPLERLQSLSSAWTFGTIQLGEPQAVSGQAEKIKEIALSQLS